MDQIFIIIKIQQNTSQYDQYEKRIKQKTSIKEVKKQLDIFHFTSFFLCILKTTSDFQVFRGCKKDQLHESSQALPKQNKPI